MHQIGFVCYDISILGGTEQVAVGIANALAKDYKVHIISVRQSGETIPYQIKDGVKVHVVLDSNLRLRQSISLFSRKVGPYLEQNEIKLLLTIGDYSGIISLPLRKKYGTNLIFCEHGALMNQWKELDVRFIRFFCAKFSHKIVTLTKENMESYKQKFHVKPEKISYIYNWIDPALLHQPSEYDKNVKKILTVGRFTPEKGHKMLVEVAKQVLPRHPDWTWEVYGDGECFEEIKTLIKETHLEKQLLLKGSDPKIKYRYHEYSFYVLTSFREGLPIVLLEAKAQKLPAVCFDVKTGPREVIRDGVNGYLVQPYCIEELTNKMESLIEDKERREAFSANTQFDIDKFSQESLLIQWKSLIDSMLERNIEK